MTEDWLLALVPQYGLWLNGGDDLSVLPRPALDPETSILMLTGGGLCLANSAIWC